MSKNQNNSNTGNSKSRKPVENDRSQSSQQQLLQSSTSTSSKTPTSTSQTMANSSFPFYLPNPNLLYSPLGLGGLNPYSLPSGMSAYDQLAQQYLLNGAGLSSSGQTGTTSSTTTSNSRQSSSNKNMSSSQRQQSSSLGLSSSTQSPNNKSRNNSNNNSSSAAAAAAREVAQLQNLLLPHDAHLLESLSRVTGLDIAQSSRGGSEKKSSSRDLSNSQILAKEALEKSEKERKKIMDSLTRSGYSPDIAAMHAFAQGKLPSNYSGGSSTSKSSNSKDNNNPMSLSGIHPEISQALFNEMAAQAAAAAAAAAVNTTSNSSKRSREQEMKEVFDQLSKSQVELFARNLGMGSAISLIPTSSSSNTMDESSSKPKRARHSDIHNLSTQHHDSNKDHQRDHREHRESRDNRDHREVRENRENRELRDNRDSNNVGALSLVTGEEKTKVRNDNATTLEKVTLSPAAAASIASLPSQTTITIAPSNNENLSTSSISPKITSTSTAPTTPSSAVSSNAGEKSNTSSSSSSGSGHHHHEMDIEDLIAPSKVSKPQGNMMAEELTGRHESETENENKNDTSVDLTNSDSGGVDKKMAGKRTTRGKRPRSNDEMEPPAIPERKRELRSSAGRAAAAAAARMAAEAKQAAQSASAAGSSNETLNLSTNEDRDESLSSP
jgi:chromodomain-helicase-DNA-binding protein 7